MIWIWSQGYGDEESILGYFGGLSIVTRCLIKRKTEGSESERRRCDDGHQGQSEREFERDYGSLNMEAMAMANEFRLQKLKQARK